MLTPTGFRQVEALARRFREIPVDACFASDLTRTSLTARAVYVPQKLPLYRDPAFREIRLGRWEDLPFGYLERFESEAITCFRKDPVSWHIEGGERFAEYTGRFIRGMQAAAARFPGKTIAIFCHSAVLRGVLMELFFRRDASQVPYCDNTAVSKLLWDGQTFTYEFLNDSSHLPEDLSAHREPGKSRNLWYRPWKGHCPRACPSRRNIAAPFGHPGWGWGRPCEPGPGEGRIARLYLLESCRDMGLEDQLLGQAVSCLRRWGHRTLSIWRTDAEPDGLLDRYGFQKVEDSWTYNLDPCVYHWEEAGQAVL